MIHRYVYANFNNISKVIHIFMDIPMCILINRKTFKFREEKYIPNSY